MYRIRSVNPVFMRLFRTKNLVLSGVPFFIVIDHKVNPVCDRIDRIRFESVLPRRGWHREWNRRNCLPNCSLPGLISAYPRCLYWKVRNARYQILSWMPWQTSWMYPLTGCWVENEKNAVDASCAHTDGDVYFMPCFSLKKARNPESKTTGKSLKFPVFWKSINAHRLNTARYKM